MWSTIHWSLYAGTRDPVYDLIIVDAPTNLQEWDLQRDHAELLSRLIRLLAPAGSILLVAGARRFKMAGEQALGGTIRELTRQTVPDDFRNQRIHRCWRLQTKVE